MCWPTLVLNLKTLFFVACVFAYGVELEAALLRFSCLNFPMVVLTLRNVGALKHRGGYNFFLSYRGIWAMSRDNQHFSANPPLFFYLEQRNPLIPVYFR
jgi:hypothetical protein